MTKIQRNGTHDAEHCVAFTTILNSFVDYSVLGSNLVSGGFGKVRHPGIEVAEVYLSKTLVEENFCRIEFELEAELFVIAAKRNEASAKPCVRGYRNCGSKSAEGARMRSRRGDGVSPGFGDSHCLVSPQILQRVFEVLEGEVESFQQKIGDTALEVSDGEVLVGFCRELEVLNRRFVVAHGGIDEAHVCKDL